MRAPESGRTETSLASERMTPTTMKLASMNPKTQPPEPAIAISSPEVMNSPMPIVPDMAIPTSLLDPLFRFTTKPSAYS